MRVIIIFFIFSLMAQIHAIAQNFTVPLWADNVPNSQKSDEKEIMDSSEIVWVKYVQEPSLSVYLPAKKQATGQAVVVCPGGGYVVLAYDWEGLDIAKWLNSKGIAAIVLKYRLPNSKSIITRHKAPLQDAQRALRVTRYHAESWNINKDKIGVMGFSAGGHLASTLGTHFDSGLESNDEIDKISSRPDFMVLVYPVISMQEGITHQGSKNSLLGENPEAILTDYYSNELQVKDNTPPTFLVHSTDDQTVPVQNSLLFYQALLSKSIPAEMHIYPDGGHGYSLAIGRGHLESWTDRCIDWLRWIDELD